MDYSTASAVLNQHIFQGDKANLFIKIAERPERFIGLFRPTKPSAKLLQNLLQSHEIRFGDAMEELFRKYIEEMGFSNLSTKIRGKEGRPLAIDQYFKKDDGYFFVEQKVRDDHDSTKKRGQISNFEYKLDFIRSLHGDHLVGIMFFIDPDLRKNHIFYHQKLVEFQEFYGIDLHLFYGPEFFAFFGHPELWSELLDILKQWKERLPDLPEINFDLTPQESFEELKSVPLLHWRHILLNDKIWDEGIMQVLFREGKTLRLCLEYFNQQKQIPYPALLQMLADRINTYY